MRASTMVPSMVSARLKAAVEKNVDPVTTLLAISFYSSLPLCCVALSFFLIGVICGFSLTFNAARFNLRQHFVVNNSRANVVLLCKSDAPITRDLSFLVSDRSRTK